MGTLTLTTWGVKEFTLCCVYCLNQPLRKIHGTASIKFNYFTIDKSNQTKISNENMRRYRSYTFSPKIKVFLTPIKNVFLSWLNLNDDFQILEAINYLNFGCYHICSNAIKTSDTPSFIINKITRNLYILQN